MEGPLRTKTYAFALRIVLLGNELIGKKEYVLSKQLLKSGTSIGVNVVEAQYAQSLPDFISKLSIALKEAHESDFWIHLLKDAGLIDVVLHDSLIKDLNEIIALLTASIKTSKSKIS